MIKTGILGTTETAKAFASRIKSSQDFELTGCFSPDYEKAKNFASIFDLIAYPSADALFKYTDALIITDFAPDFLSITSKALKNFKHVLISNPFLAALEEIQQLRKISEESRVIFQINGAFSHPLFSEIQIQPAYLAEMRRSISSETCYSGHKYMEIVMQDIYLVLYLLKGYGKRLYTNSWDCQGMNPDVISARIELDNGSIANLLINRTIEENGVILDLIGPDGSSRVEENNLKPDHEPAKLKAIEQELLHFSQRIHNPYASAWQDDVIFQALELSYAIKNKSSRHFTIDAQN